MLNSKQEQVANHKQGHAKVLAAAGSGKSTTMIQRVSRLVETGVQQREILSVMFNRDARDSYKDKLLDTYSKDKCPPVFTFHGLGGNIQSKLVENGELPKCRLETSEYKLFNAAKEALMPWISEIKAKRQIVMEFISFVDLVKNSIGKPIDVFSDYGIPGKFRFFLDAFKAFERQRMKDKTQYFSDLIYTPIMFLKKNTKKAEDFSNRYQHIIVDEFQDISDIQMAMIQILAGKKASVMVVGDDDQCIYSWRGAKPDYLISGFDKFFPKPTVYTLNETYRYGHQLSLAATHVIKNNSTRAPKICISNVNCNPTDVSLDVEKVGQPSVPKQISDWTKSGRELSEVAVLVRSFSQAVPVELALLQSGIPYTVEGGTALFDTPDIGALLAGLHIGAGTFEDLPETDKRKMISYFIRFPSLGMSRDVEYQLITEALSNLEDPVGALDTFTFKVQEQWIKDRLLRRARVWRNLQVMTEEPVDELIDYIVEETGVNHHIEYVAKNVAEAEDMRARYEVIKVYAAHRGETTVAFARHLETLRKGVDKDGNRGEGILITSVHRSKGLEWPFVIMPGLAQGKFPYIPRTSDQAWNIEDERRLFYVGMTRAQEKLVMICPNDRKLALFLGKGSDSPPEIIEPDPANASQFVYETNIYLSQRIDLLIQGKAQLPNGVVSPESTRAYLKAIREQ